MFTKYRGIEIPQNYSGSRFSVPPPETEMKTHRPSTVYTPSKTSISPTFQASLDALSAPSQIEEIPDNVYEIEDESYESTYNQSDDYSDSSEESSEYDIRSKKDQESSKSNSVFEEFKPFVNKFLKNITSDDLLLLSLVLLLFGDGGEESSELILPLLCLFLYR